MARALLLDTCVVIDFAECGVEVLALASRHIGQVHVAEPVLAEVRSVRFDASTITAIEPSIEELEEAAVGRGGLSFTDRVTLVTARRRGLVVVTSDRALRRACLASGVEASWSLEILLALVSAGALPAESAAQAARGIHGRNPWHVDRTVLATFVEKLARLSATSADVPHERPD